ncbi:RES family NAD+ phosphorylase [Brucella sp. HL-2]|nr:RES family NAD+ phosphorylase [Brucella sp. HL-2]MCV9907578.1 RES family NAD+ phosphorylase [Brucella sp. HL-2]
MSYQDKLYRALNPVFAREPLSGRGAELYGGRFNPKGGSTLYASLSIMTALREANQVGNLQPTTIVSYDAEVEAIFDCRNELALEEMGMDAVMLADDGWREQMRLKGEATTQIFARRLIAAGYSGLLVRSFAKGTNKDDLNLVLWRWGPSPPSRLTLIDDENSLSR